MKRFILFFITIFIAVASFSNPVSEELIESVAHAFLADKLGKNSVELNLAMKSKENAWYLYSDDNSWVIISGDTELYPVLGFSTESSISQESMPPAMLSYLNAREKQLLEIRKHRVSHPENRIAWEAVLKGSFAKSRSNMAPLLETRWNQGWPYNMLCPEHPQGPGGHVYAGCVATAMAQVMKFHNYPETGRFVGTYYYGEYINVDFSQGNYRWDDMSVSATSMSREAIAKLMFHCGVAVDMDYDYDGSGAVMEIAAQSLKYYFKYKSGLKFVQEKDYSDADWKFLLKEDLDKQHPILYRGTDDSGGGHAFVCDAYQDTSYFHFNWGWSGSGDGFFHLDDQSFHWGQAAIINIIPYWGAYCNSMIYTQDSWSFHDGSGYNLYWNNSDCEWIINPENAEKVTLDFSSFETEIEDVLYVYDGLTEEAPLLGQFSGSEIPATITSSGNEMLLRFVTDGDGQARGWYAEYMGIVSGASKQLKQNDLFSIYPNPVESIVNVQFAEPGKAKVDLFDYTGRLLTSIVVDDMLSSLDIQNLPSGLYFIKVQQGDYVAQKQLIKL